MNRCFDETTEATPDVEQTLLEPRRRHGVVAGAAGDEANLADDDVGAVAEVPSDHTRHRTKSRRLPPEVSELRGVVGVVEEAGEGDVEDVVDQVADADDSKHGVAVDHDPPPARHHRPQRVVETAGTAGGVDDDDMDQSSDGPPADLQEGAGLRLRRDVGHRVSLAKPNEEEVRQMSPSELTFIFAGEAPLDPGEEKGKHICAPIRSIRSDPTAYTADPRGDPWRFRADHSQNYTCRCRPRDERERTPTVLPVRSESIGRLILPIRVAIRGPPVFATHKTTRVAACASHARAGLEKRAAWTEKKGGRTASSVGTGMD